MTPVGMEEAEQHPAQPTKREGGLAMLPFGYSNRKG